MTEFTDLEIEIPIFSRLQYKNFLGHVIGYKIDILISRISINDDITTLAQLPQLP